MDNFKPWPCSMEESKIRIYITPKKKKEKKTSDKRKYKKCENILELS